MSLKVRRLTEEPGSDEFEEGYRGVNTVWMVLRRTDLAGFSSRIFRVEPGGHTPVHAHDRGHVAMVIRGICRVECGSEVEEVGEGCIVTIPSNAAHRFSNPGRERLVLLVMNLHVDPSKTVKAASEPTIGCEGS